LPSIDLLLVDGVCISNTKPDKAYCFFTLQFVALSFKVFKNPIFQNIMFLKETKLPSRDGGYLKVAVSLFEAFIEAEGR